MEDSIILLILAVVIGLAVRSIIKAKKNGKKCIGCPDGCDGNCGGSCHGCGHHEK